LVHDSLGFLLKPFYYLLYVLRATAVQSNETAVLVKEACRAHASEKKTSEAN